MNLKKIIQFNFSLLFVFNVIVIFVSCGKNKNEEDKNIKIEHITTKLFKGDHKLRKFKSFKSKKEETRGGYFLMGGSIYSETSTKKKASFSWQIYNGDYVISEIDILKIRVRIDSTVKNPYIKFKWRDIEHFYSHEIEYYITHCVDHIVVVCREEDYPIEIDLN